MRLHVPPLSDRPRIQAAAGTVSVAGRPLSTGAPAWGHGGDFLVTAGFLPAGGPATWDRAAAMSIPAISRARDLICDTVGALPFTLWATDSTDPTAPVEVRLPDAGWMDRPDPNRTLQWMLSWTTDDLIFYGVAHWRIVDRYAKPNDYPRALRRLTPGQLSVQEDGTVMVDDHPVDDRDIVEFCSPNEGILANGWRAISIAWQLDDAADRFASTELPTGVLEEQPGGEDLDSTKLAELADQFSAARRSNSIAATNKYLRYREVQNSASAMQLVEGRQYQALECARLTDVPAYLIGAPTGTGMTYQNAAQARGDLIDFGALPYIGCIEQTCSGPNVTPLTQHVRLNVDAWLRSPFTDPTTAPTAPTPPAAAP